MKQLIRRVFGLLHFEKLANHINYDYKVILNVISLSVVNPEP